MEPLPFYLASASPRRLELLRQIGLEPIVRPVDADETPLDGEPPDETVRRLAALKGRRAVEGLRGEPAGLVLAADTEVVLDGRSLGKPADAAAAREMLRRLRGREHEVLTGVFLARTDDGRELCEIERTRVGFRPFDDATIEAYLATGEGADKAGAYGIQGRGVLLSERIEGSWSNVVGLPLERLAGWLARLDVDLWRTAGRRSSG